MNRIAILCFGVTFLPGLRCLANESKPTLLEGHTGWIGAIAYSPDGKMLASASADNTVRLWDAATGQVKVILKGHTDYVCALAFSRDSKRLATGSYDHTARLWDADKGEVIATLKGHEGVVLAVAFHPEGKIIATGSVDRQIALWSTDPDKKEPLSILKGHKSWVNGLAFNFDGSRLASASSDETVRVWNPNSGETLARIHGGAGEVRSIAWSPDAKLIAAGNRYGTVLVGDPDGKVAIVLKGHASDVWAIAFSPDGKTLAAADTDWKKPGSIKLWNTETWKEHASLPCPAEILALAWSTKGDRIAVGCWDKIVRVYSVVP